MTTLTGTLLWVKRYTHDLNNKLQNAKDWIKVFSLWKNLIELYRYSIPELIEATLADPSTKDFRITALLNDLLLEENTKSLNKADGLFFGEEQQLIYNCLQQLGASLAETEVQQLENCISELDKFIKEKEITVKERTALLYKLTPLFCGGIAVILW